MVWGFVLAAGLGFVLLLFGISSLRHTNFWWKVQQFDNQVGGVQSERTDSWQVGLKVSGCLFILLGIGFVIGAVYVLIAFILPSLPNEEDRNLALTATARPIVESLNARYGAAVEQWQLDASSERPTILPLGNIFGGDATAIYGRCAGERFFAYIVGGLNSFAATAYVPDGTPADCHPEGMLNPELFVRIGAGWFRGQAAALSSLLTVTPGMRPTPPPTGDE